MLSQGLAGQSEIIFGECEVAINIDILCIYFVRVYEYIFIECIHTEELFSLFVFVLSQKVNKICFC